MDTEKERSLWAFTPSQRSHLPAPAPHQKHTERVPLHSHEMNQSELNPLIIPSATNQNYQTESSNLRARGGGRTGKTPSSPMMHNSHSNIHHDLDGGGNTTPHDDTDPAGGAAVATSGTSRQLFYRDRIPQLPSESRDYARHNVPVMSNSDSSDSSVMEHQYYHQQQFAYDGTRIEGPMLPPPSPHPPQHLHPGYSDRYYRNQLADPGNTGAFVVGGSQRYRGNNNGVMLVEVSEEVYAVRKAALTVLDPITYCWVSCLVGTFTRLVQYETLSFVAHAKPFFLSKQSQFILTLGFSVAVALGAAKYTGKLINLPYWAIFLPAWVSHLGIVVMHLLSAKALSQFISEANENRQRPDSTDHLDRVEYLPLLQRSLKFGLKTGVLCFVAFVFEVLMFVRLCNPSAISLTVTFIPFWILTLGFIANGIVCKTQHFLQLLVWILLFTAMLLTVLQIDYGVTQILSSHIIMTIQGMLAIISGTLIYVIYGHQIGYFKLTESQLTAGVFYATSSFLAILLVAILGDREILPDVIQLDMLLIIVILAPIVVALAGFGAWFVTRDEFDRLMKDGGQSAVIPMRLKLEADGWTCVESKGVATIPMFGEVRYVYRRLHWTVCSCHTMLTFDRFRLQDMNHWIMTQQND